MNRQGGDRLYFAAIDEAKLVVLAGELARTAPHEGVVTLQGTLGAGKTTLVRAFLRALGHAGAVRSPTYTLIEPYELGGRQIFHFDLYRLACAEELDEMGVRDYFGPDRLAFIEWPERGAGVLPDPDIEISLSYAGGEDCAARDVVLQALSMAGREWLARLLSSDNAQVIAPVSQACVQDMGGASGACP
ncbi:MAG: tRNA (adenosine(37)-N6)-threonylcarbamoyltransferase complex ATPase subunit type 1 TsaE [Pseudomonadota bacterium]